MANPTNFKSGKKRLPSARSIRFWQRVFADIGWCPNYDQRTIDKNKHTGRKWAVSLLITLAQIFLVVADIALWA